MMTQPPMQDKFIIKTEPLLTNFKLKINKKFRFLKIFIKIYYDLLL